MSGHPFERLVRSAGRPGRVRMDGDLLVLDLAALPAAGNLAGGSAPEPVTLSVLALTGGALVTVVPTYVG
jgi:hypothetical protein